MIYQQQRYTWELRRRRMEVQFVRFQLRLEQIASDWVPDGQILILAGAAIVGFALLVALFTFFQGTGTVESDAFGMLQSVRDPAEIITDSNPLLNGVAMGGIVLLGLVALGSALVCIDRVKQKMEIED